MAAEVVFVPDWQSNITAPLSVVLDKIGADIVDDAKRLVPVLSGKTRDSLEHHSEESVSGPVEVIQAHTAYAHFVEDGTSRMAAQPFLKPALYRKRG